MPPSTCPRGDWDAARGRGGCPPRAAPAGPRHTTAVAAVAGAGGGGRGAALAARPARRLAHAAPSGCAVVRLCTAGGGAALGRAPDGRSVPAGRASPAAGGDTDGDGQRQRRRRARPTVRRRGREALFCRTRGALRGPAAAAAAAPAAPTAAGRRRRRGAPPPRPAPRPPPHGGG
ncbi:hypothetical protein BU14_0108s0016 [Porphyra umbilicalis]|uniref:Uncharacterized protein n=1 Tax=Porphyra umbilicalis TaxID=2786 RepID=A0A1X6PC18_PORUM|nr:hypothetical protein BU14_0108s0016 [Porphyra umbilicalis]|eukprot:OSX78469.1 hypothetical protein BU14_0108s0016 [Porphyra umbilicalis]